MRIDTCIVFKDFKPYYTLDFARADVAAPMGWMQGAVLVEVVLELADCDDCLAVVVAVVFVAVVLVPVVEGAAGHFGQVPQGLWSV